MGEVYGEAPRTSLVSWGTPFVHLSPVSVSWWFSAVPSTDPSVDESLLRTHSQNVPSLGLLDPCPTGPSSPIPILGVGEGGIDIGHSSYPLIGNHGGLCKLQRLHLLCCPPWWHSEHDVPSLNPAGMRLSVRPWWWCTPWSSNRCLQEGVYVLESSSLVLVNWWNPKC